MDDPEKLLKAFFDTGHVVEVDDDRVVIEVPVATFDQFCVWGSDREDIEDDTPLEEDYRHARFKAVPEREVLQAKVVDTTTVRIIFDEDGEWEGRIHELTRGMRRLQAQSAELSNEIAKTLTKLGF